MFDSVTRELHRRILIHNLTYQGVSFNSDQPFVWEVVSYIVLNALVIISPTLIAELICGLLEPYLKFKTPVSIYCKSIYLQSMLLKVVLLLRTVSMSYVNQIIVSLLLKVSVYVIRLIPGIATKKIFSKSCIFICSWVSRDTLWYIIKCFKKFHQNLTCCLSGMLVS